MQPPVVSAAPLTARTVVRRSAPRLVGNAVGPLVAFYVGWKLAGVAVGIAAASALGVVIYLHERRRGRPALVVRVALALVLIRAIAGLASGSARVYLGQEIAIDVVLGAIVIGSLVRGRPLAGAFAQEIYPIPDDVARGPILARAFRIITLVWGAYFWLRALVRLAALLTLSVDQYVLVAAVSDAPFLLALIAWGVVYTIRTVRAADPTLLAQAADDPSA